jgi:hypothetical protein
VVADSGNGYHLLYRVDLPTNDDQLVKRVLAALASRYNTNQVKIDEAVFNPSRIVKLYGTMARKGDSTSERPHRWSKVISLPKRLEAVPRELLEELAKEGPQPVIALPRAISPTNLRYHLATVDRDTRIYCRRWRTGSGKEEV